MTSVDAILVAPPLAGLARVNDVGGQREVTSVRLAEQFADLEAAPAGSFVILGRVASESATDYRFDMALRWAALAGVSAVAAFAAGALASARHGGRHRESRWPGADLGSRGLRSSPTCCSRCLAEVGGGPARALARASAGLDAVDRAEQAGADLGLLCAMVGEGLGTPVVNTPADPATSGSGAAASELSRLAAPQAHGDLAVAARLVLRAATGAAARLADEERKARELPIRSRAELLAELLISESTLNEDMLERARQLGIPLSGWHVALLIEADNLADVAPDEIGRFELLESAGQVALNAAALTGGTWYLSRIARAIVLVWMTSSDPGGQAGQRASRSAAARSTPSGRGTPHCTCEQALAHRMRVRSACEPRPLRLGERSSLRAQAASRRVSLPTMRLASSGC